ncbi:MAG: nucleoside-diphosphate kinase, partial [Patescibacteria group bacterium]|nr:nucleoside-diphosphate kinase [Patescibacteria group bacterium]
MSHRERTMVIMKPDALHRNLIGDIISRFEYKGLKIVGLKMAVLDDMKLDDHYAHHKDKPFFESLKTFMKESPVVIMALEGKDAVQSVRLLAGDTKGADADAGTIRGDFAISVQNNLVHTSDSPETAEQEIARFFDADELYA